MRKRLFLGVGVLTALALAGWWYHGRGRSQHREAAEAPEPDPRAAFSTPYLNVGPEAKYVGDRACAECHPDQAETFRHHPMGNSFFPMATRAAQERLDPAAHNPFEKFGFEFRVERQGDRVFHRETRKDGQGRVLTELTSEAQYVMGSGSHGRSYLVNHDGFLFQSPVSWYSDKQAWDLSPGFIASTHANRVIKPECLFCHCNYADYVPGSMNHYREPIFRGYAVGCERCHGPGALHVQARERAASLPRAGHDYTIVNPAHLAPALRDAVCEQCHLQGDARLVRRDKDLFAYRPGLPLHWFWSVFTRRPGFADYSKAVNHVQQMHVSRCFQASQGRFTCISCHDPHGLPAPAKKAAYYRDRCLKCHQERGCRLSPATRLAQKGDDCTACHMPSFGLTDIGHAAFTDHRIPRRPDQDTPMPPSARMQLLPGEMPVVHFHQAILDLPGRETSRDLGVALVELIQNQPAAQPLFAPLAAPLLEAAVRAWPDDAEARERQALLVGTMLRRPQEGLALYEALLTRFPEREMTLLQAARLAERMGRPEDAVRYWRRAVALNPWNAHYHHFLAAHLADRREELPNAIKECQAALQLDPANTEVRGLLMRCLLAHGDKAQARAEFEKLAVLDPAGSENLRVWFEDRMAR